LVESELRLKDGETMMIGASKMNGNDKAIIVILSAKLLKD
jgi:hypothetical protein